MQDDLYERFGDILHETPEAEDALRAWRDRQAREAIMRNLRRRQTEILVKSLGGLPEPDWILSSSPTQPTSATVVHQLFLIPPYG
jgi:hypothetical protein